ncbi:MAG TPA: hypothetical protein VJ698_19230 [Noviherbaspirillum sp.]|uniref:hypothetical protein n=1 Tax=Noviherbaspirillum sp. TaxID=1926288 RepID=UPI002B480B9D|nr:hypothetical protein [Noviherbaspirillum sp.]HJV87610.1 hypothetical protein [Noviherbaspirillum sp.]
MIKSGGGALALAMLLVIALSGCGGADPQSTARQSTSSSTLLAASTTETWTKCANENQTCSFSGTTQVRYGLNGTWATRTATNAIGCDNSVFGDPLPGADKICEFLTVTTEPPPPPPPSDTTWTKCANENQTCTFPGTTQVRYGLNGTWATRTATNAIGCNNDVFGDPLPGADKICEYASTSPTPVTGQPAPVPDGTPMTMSCIEGANTQCSGRSIIRIENGITLTSAGVQAYGKSTNDLAVPIANATAAYGLVPASGGLAEIRALKSSDGVVSNPVMLLSKLGISWDGKVERPPIIETFRATQGHMQVDASGAISAVTLPPSSDLAFYDVAGKGVAGTQANYANNSYFPRSEPSRCPPEMVPCPLVETKGLKNQAGDWQNGGIEPNIADISRLHEDGDVHAGNGLPDANGNPTILPGGSGFGVPFPGSKGYRQLTNWSYRYATLGAWFTQDTVRIVEWTGGAGTDEHNQARTGMVAFGQVTDPANVPASGSAGYTGIVYGWYTPNGTQEAAFFRGSALVAVDFATRTVSISIQNTHTWDAAWAEVPVALSGTTMMGATGSNVANYLTGTISNASLSGGLGGRFFGPVVTTGNSGAGPAEIGGSFSLSNGATKAAVVGGFIARKQ